MTDRVVRVVLQAVVDDYRKAMGNAAKDTESLGKTTEKSSKDSTAALGDLGKKASVAGGVMLAGFGVAVTAAAGFEQKMSGVKAVANATAGEMKHLSDAALQAGADTSFSASEAAEAEAELAKAGVSVKDILGGGLSGALSLAAAGQLELADAATISAQAMNVFKLEGKDVGHIADVLAAAANKSASDVKDLGDGLRQGGLVAAQTGLSLEETTGALAAFADNALIGSDAGTSLKTMLQRLTPQSEEAEALMERLGIKAYDASGQFVGLAGFSQNLKDSLSKLTDEQRNSALATIFGSDAVRAAAILYDQGAAGINDYVTAVDDQGAAARMASTQMDNLAGDVEALKGSLETALIKGGSGATGVLRGMTQAATDAVNAFGQLPTPVQQGATALVGITGAVAVVGGAVMVGVGQLAKFKTALTTTGVSAQRTAMMVRGAGIAMKGIGIAAGVAALTMVLEQINTAGAKKSQLPRITENLVDLAQQGHLTGEALKTFGDDFSGLGKKIDVAGRGYWTSFTTGQKSIKNAQTDLDDLDKALAGLLQQGHGDEAAAIFTKIEEAAKRQGISVGDLNKTFNDYRDAQADARTQTKLSSDGMGTAASSADLYAQKLEEQAKAAQDAAIAIRDQSQAMKAQFDPLFAVQDAIAAQTKAQHDLNQARKEHGRRSVEYAEADQAVLRATIDVDTAVHELKASLTDGSTSLQVVNGRLDAFVRAGLISTTQAKRYKEQLAGATRESNTLAGAIDRVNGKPTIKPKVNVKPLRDAETIAGRLGRKLETLDGMNVSPRIHVIISQTGAISGVSNSRDEDFAGRRASGGPVSAGGMYLVGEQGPELVRFSQAGQVYTAADTRAMLGGNTAPLVGEMHIHPLPTENYEQTTSRGLRELAFRIAS